MITSAYYQKIDRHTIDLYNVHWSDVNYQKISKSTFSKTGAIMKRKKLSDYIFTEADIYEIRRTSNTQIAYDYFCNYVTYAANKRTISISVDNSREDYNKKKADEDDPEKIEGRKILEDFIIKRNTKYFERLSKKYTIKNSLFSLDNKLPLNNILSGSTVEIGIGEGILDFIYADFVTPLNNSYSDYLYIKSEIKNTLPGFKFKYRSKPFDVEDQDTPEEYHFYKTTALIIARVIYSSIYTAVSPPAFHIDSKNAVRECFEYYGNYLLLLQNEYLELIEFCFDENFYPNILGNLTPAERYALYRKLKHLPTELERFEMFRIYDKDENAGDINIEISSEEKELAERLKFNANELVKELNTPKEMNVSYIIRAVRGLLELEFTKMLELDIHFRKCKRCGKYFIMKGNYDTNYCDRIARGEAKNCQDIMAMEKYKQKMADNAAIGIYNKYYKRYSARVKVHTILEADFKKWKYQAITKRDECMDGKITEEEFIDWMESCFTNRNRKH